MTKSIVETSGKFMLINADNSEIHHDRPTLTKHTTFVDECIASGRLKLFATSLPETASDADFFKTWKEAKGDRKLAVEAYCAELGLNPAGQSIKAEKGKGGKEHAKGADHAEMTMPITDPEEIAKQKEDQDLKDKQEIEKAHISNVGKLPEMQPASKLDMNGNLKPETQKTSEKK